MTESTPHQGPSGGPPNAGPPEAGPPPEKRKRSWTQELSDPGTLLLLIMTLFFLQRAAFVWVTSRAPLFGAVFDDTSVAYGNWACRLLQGAPGPVEGAFPMPPLYAYLLAAVYRFSGSVAAARIINVLLTCGAGWAVYDVGRRLGGPAAGLVGCSLYFLHGFTLFYEGVLDGGTLMATTGTLTLWGLVVAADTRRPLAWAGAGLALGLFALATGSPALLVGLAALGALSVRRRAWWAAALLLVLGLAIPLAPSLAHNLAEGGGPVVVSWNVGGALYNANNPDNPRGIYVAPSFTVATGDDFGLKSYAREAEHRLGKPVTTFQASLYWAGEVWRFLAEKPAQFLALQARKVLLFWNRYEMPGAIDPGLARQYVWPLRTALVGFGLLAPLGLVGAVWAWRRGAAGRVAVLYLALAAATAFPFTILARRRLPLIPALAALAACLIVALWRNAAALRGTRATGAGAPPPDPSVPRPPRRRLLRRLAACALGLALAAVFVNQGWVTVAGTLPPGFNDYTLAIYYSRIGQLDRSLSIAEAAVRANPERAYLRLALAELYQCAGRPAEAVATWEEGLRLKTGQANDYVILARLAAAAGDAPRAVEAARHALGLDDRWSEARCALSEALLLAGDGGAAVAAAREAVALDPQNPTGYNDLGLALEARGDMAAARQAWQEAIRVAPEYTPARDNLARTGARAPTDTGR